MPVLCNKRCVRKLQFVVRAWIDLNKNTIHLMALAISRFTEYRLFALFWLLPGRPRCAGYWQAVLGRQNFPYACLCLAHTDICATSDPSKSKRPALAKISCPSVMVSRDKWMEARGLSMETLHWSKLMIPDVPIEPHKGLYTCAIKSTTFCFEIGIL